MDSGAGPEENKRLFGVLGTAVVQSGLEKLRDEGS